MGSYLVTAAAAGFIAESAQHGEPLHLGETLRSGVDVVLQAGGSRVNGTVVDAAGEPVPHASVRAERQIDPRVSIALEADDRGHFGLSLPWGPIVLSAHARTFASAWWNGPAPSPDVRLVLVPGATLRGRVVSGVDGGPLPDIAVRASPSGKFDLRLWCESTTDADGAFEIQGMEAGSYELLASGEGWRSDRGAPTRVDLGTTVDDLRIEAYPVTQVSGRVLVENAGPCEQGVVSLGSPDPHQPLPDKPLPMGHEVPTITANIGVDGGVRFSAVPQGRYYVSVRCSNRIVREGPRVLDIGATGPSDLTWTVAPGPSLIVIAVDGRGRPVPDAAFFLRYPRGLRSAARTRSDGRYEFAGELYPGKYEITAGQPFNAQAEPVELDESAGPVTARLTFAGSGSIVATVHAKDGSPLDGLVVSAVARSTIHEDLVGGPSSKYPPGAHTFIATAMGDGRYRIMPLEAASYEVRVDDGINPTVRKSYSLSADRIVEPDFEIERGGRIRGLVIDEDAAPVARVWVSTNAMKDDDPDRPVLLHAMVGTAMRALTDQRGRFVLEGLTGADTRYGLRVEGPDGQAAALGGLRASDEDVVVTLPAAGTLSGTIVGSCSASTVPVRLQATNMSIGQVVSEEFAGLPRPFHLNIAPGQIKLSAFCLDGQRRAQWVRGLSTGENVNGLSLTLEPPSSVQAGR